MEHQTDPPSRSGPVSQDSGVTRIVSANASADAADRNIANTDATILSAGIQSDKPGSVETISLKTQYGTYIWPFELCRSFEVTKPLIEEVYALRHDERHVHEVRKGEYDIQTEDGAVILPTVWNTIVQPFTTIRISFWADDLPSRKSSPKPEGARWDKRISDEDSASLRDDGRRMRPRGYDRVITREVLVDVGDERRRPREYDARPREYDARVTIDVDDPVPSPSPSPPSPPPPLLNPISEGDDTQSEGIEIEVDSDTIDSAETEDEDFQVVEDFEPFREVNLPTDADGNKLSFSVDTSLVGHDPRVQNELESKFNESKEPTRPKGALERDFETLRITKAVSVEVEARSIIEIHTLPGPTISQLRESVAITWCHIQAERLDFSRFKEVCLGLPNVSNRLQTLTREILAKIEKHKVKAYLGGLFIEPGTVLRADERCQPNPEAVVFTCIPYYDLQPVAKKLSSTGAGERLFPPRTLMQSFYPFEPVQERDPEQAYKRFGNAQSKSLVHVPNLWMMNIGTDIVVTYGHKTLAEEMTKSIGVVQEDLRQLGMTDIRKNTLTNIRLIDWNSHVYLYQLNACRSYFQMEQKLRDLRDFESSRKRAKSLLIVWNSSEGKIVVTPKQWSTIIRRTDLIFIDLVSLDAKDAKEIQAKTTIEKIDLVTSVGSVPPFFQWLPAVEREVTQQETVPQGTKPPNTSHMLQYLGLTEKALLTETLDEYDTANEVDKSFASTTFYQTLPEETYDRVSTQFTSLVRNKQQSNGYSHHATVVVDQCTDIVTKADSLCKTVQSTMRLFVSDVDKSSVLRKVWGAMSNVHSLVTNVQMRNTAELNSVESSSSFTIPSHADDTGWYIRNGKEQQIALPCADEKFKWSLRHCRRCTSLRPFNNAEAATNHLQLHAELQATNTQISGLPLDNGKPNSQENAAKLNLTDWIVDATQLRREKSNAGALEIITHGCEEALQLFSQINELAHGVQNEDGKKSELYTFPRHLLGAFRKITVFYLAIERALHHSEKSYQDLTGEKTDEYGVPYTKSVLTVLTRFAKGAEKSIAMAREELCNMTRPNAPLDDMHGLSLGPQYVCGWLMRRLLVKPLEKRMTIGDMYREYLSTVQFQVNHRPGKRLIRSINLLQEELQILIEVNKWQTQLIDNYIRVLDDTTYEKDIPSRRAMFPYERMLLESCRDNLALSREEYEELFNRCGPLSDRTKQSLEINEEDHGKAIMVFTIVTIIFLPLSFVTSYLGMNTADIRDMDSQQSLFWIIAVPLALVTMGSTMFIGYNGDELRDALVYVYRTAIKKQNSSTSARGISVAQRKRARYLHSDSNSALNDTSLADEAEYASPRPDLLMDDYGWTTFRDRQNTFEADTTLQAVQPRANFKTQSLPYGRSAAVPAQRPRPPRLPPPRPRLHERQDVRLSKYSRPPIPRYESEDEWGDRPVLGRTPKVTTYNTYESPRYPSRTVDVQEYTWRKKNRCRPAGGGRCTRL